ncbi:MAG: hypothetical protein HOO98_05105 [Nitrospira sp.]|nr:hypothetical protein [Nitrospira sp.]
MATTKMPEESPPSTLNGNVTHGDTLLKKAVKELGTKALDGRSVLAIELKQERRELIQALGGPSEISPQEMAIIEMIAMKRIRRKPIQEWALLNRDALFNRRNKCLAPIALQLEQLEESEVRLLKELGLKRRAKQIPSLSDYLNGAKATKPDSKDGDACP